MKKISVGVKNGEKVESVPNKRNCRTKMRWQDQEVRTNQSKAKVFGEIQVKWHNNREIA